ncbi:MAG TPA: 4Fe-4S binding protein [Firmicutes bacterium]|nr:4Fe-4S binding protein [Bacillota bacterium]
MDYPIQLKKSNCKNCYKCIRFCPVKSIKMEDHHAIIIQDECILCGRCYVNCPQNAKRLRDDLDIAKALIASGDEVYASIAPSYIANYKVNITAMEKALKKLGFAGVEETAIGATIVKKEYEKLVKSRSQKVIISSCCHSINTLIQKKYPEALPYLAKVLSPMQAHGQLLKEQHGGCKTVFIGPCIAKKDEADKMSGYIDCTLTFDDLSRWLDESGVEIENCEPENETRGRARLFPIRGGILGSMDLEDDYTYFAIDGLDDCMNALEDVASGAISDCFIEMSACDGSCIGGPVMKRDKLYHVSECITIGKTVDKGLDFSVPEDEDTAKSFIYEGKRVMRPGALAIKEVLHSIGKFTPEQELNCGSCGYPTCRDKAIAVLQGKADMTMCLPYLKEKAESFSDKVINSSPNGITVLNDKLQIQQMNKAAQEIFNIKRVKEIIGEPIVVLTDPTDYMFAVNNITSGKAAEIKNKYLSEYGKYVEETIVYDPEYKIIISIMKDVTAEETEREKKEEQSKKAVEITDKVVEKQMRVVQEIASLLGETTAETKIALTRLKETLSDE